MGNVAAAFLIAALVPALLAGALSASFRLVPGAFMVSLMHTMLLGAPLVVFLWRRDRITAIVSTLSGFGIGAAGIAVLTFPLWFAWLQTDVWIGAEQVQTVDDGIPTLAGWLRYLRGMVTFGAFGATGGFAFWLWLQITDSLPSAGRLQSPDGLSLRRFAGPLVIIAVVIIVALPNFNRRDESCHNALRDGRGHANPEAVIDLDITDQELDDLRQLFQSFAASEKLSFRDSGKDYQNSLALSVCNDRATIDILESQAARGAMPASLGIGIVVFEVEENSGWAALTRRLIDRLEQRWPGKVRFLDSVSRFISRPDSLKPASTDDEEAD